MSATVLNFRKTSRSAPMSQVLPTPRFDVVGPLGEWPEHSYDVERVDHDGTGDSAVVATFGASSEAENFADEKNRRIGLGGAA